MFVSCDSCCDCSTAVGCLRRDLDKVTSQSFERLNLTHKLAKMSTKQTSLESFLGKRKRPTEESEEEPCKKLLVNNLPPGRGKIV